MKIIYTLGDVNGIGLEVFFKTLKYFSQNPNSLSEDSTFYIAANVGLISKYLDFLKSKAKLNSNSNLFDDIKIVENSEKANERIDESQFSINYIIKIENIECKIIEIVDDFELEPGINSANAGLAAIKSIEFATVNTLNKIFDAIITLPISKKAIQMAGSDFQGHTEMLADICNSSNYQMILFHEKIRVALVTIHIPIHEIEKNINKENLENNIIAFNNSLQRDFAIKNPKIAILGLNPHAGENGKIGHHENKIILPLLQVLNSQDYDLEGPYPADGFFAHGLYKKFDGILAMYHDQGLIPLKLLAQGAGTNFTAGLPIVRCSPDHGTAFNIAFEGIADALSTINSTIEAVNIFHNNEKYKIK